MDNTESIQHYIYRVKQCIVASINTQKAFHELIQYVFSSQKETSSERRYRLFRSLIETKLYPKICFEAITALLQDVSTIEDINLVEELVNCIQATEIQDDITKTKIDLFLLRIMNDDEQPQARSNALQHIQKFAEDHNLVTEH